MPSIPVGTLPPSAFTIKFGLSERKRSVEEERGGGEEDGGELVPDQFELSSSTGETGHVKCVRYVCILI
ncbi:hypothetical protein EYF80_036463 [Liparis tanakae]|uniref:Uncharacterized protein n=1 Tax=Liparis tanakae TaxID=230148 RepID=A0A4Z2GIE3_9TELE|nr:hypothetical protein EYF80_036463 [Liparis tanakae]